MSDELCDLRIENDDLLFGPDGEPDLVFRAEALAQDLAHKVRESGLVVKLVGLRDSGLRSSILQEIRLLIEADDRVVPGSVTISESSSGIEFKAASADETVVGGTVNA